MALQRIWEELKIGSVTIKNRIARAAHCLSLSPNLVEEDFIAYHLARARDGVGLNILEAASVHGSSVLGYMVDDNAARAYEKMMGALRPYDIKVFQQLWHGGHIMPGLGGAVPWSASAVAGPISGMVALPMTRENIDEIVESYAAAAVRCFEAGLNGVEVQTGHGYLLHQFLSPLSNIRTDEFGGSFENRSRFLRMILTEIRKRVGGDFAVGVRMSPSLAAGGMLGDDVARLARELESDKLIDYLNLSYSDYYARSGQVGPMTWPSGYQVDRNASILSSVTIPRLVTGRIRTLEEAEEILRSGGADMVSLVRALIADPDLITKTKNGNVEDVRPCIACNQGCVGGLLQYGRTQCTVNPTAGWEQTLGEHARVKTDSPRRVMVVGGGPAGMEAARVAAQGGHRVTLAEAGSALGGKIIVARKAPYLAIFDDLRLWLESQVYKLDVDVRLSSYCEEDDVRSENPDVLIIATGAMSAGDGRQAEIPGELPEGMDQPHVHDPLSLLSLPVDLLKGRTAVVFDDTGRYEAIASAEYLCQHGFSVKYVTSKMSFGPKMAGTFRDEDALVRLNSYDFELIINHHLCAIETGIATIRPAGVYTRRQLSADIVVVETAPTPMRSLADTAGIFIPEVHIIGDARSPRDMFAAMHEGHRVARQLA